MTVVQNRILRIIGVSKARALSAYGISSVPSFLESCSTAQVRKLLSESTTQLPQNLKSKATVHHHKNDFVFDVPRDSTTKFANSSVIKTLQLMRDERLVISWAQPFSAAEPAPPPKLTQECPFCKVHFKQLSKHKFKARPTTD